MGYNLPWHIQPQHVSPANFAALLIPYSFITDHGSDHGCRGCLATGPLLIHKQDTLCFLLSLFPPSQVMAQIMGAEAALVRIQFMSGTHAIAAALYAALRPGDEMLAVAGQ